MKLHSEYPQQILDRLAKLRELRDLIVMGRERGYLELSEAQRVIELVKDLIEDLSGGKAKFTLHLLDVAEKIIEEPGPLIRKAALKRFNRDDIIPKLEYVAEELPKRSILEHIRGLPILRKKIPIINKTPIEVIADRIGITPRVLKALLDVRLKDLISELGYIFQALLETIVPQEKRLEEYIRAYGIRDLKITKGEALSVLAETVARVWLSVVLKGPWLSAEPVFYQSDRINYEYDAVAIQMVEDRVEVYIAEVEVKCCKFMREDRHKPHISRIRAKIGRLKYLLQGTLNYYKQHGAKRARLTELLLLCYDIPDIQTRQRLKAEAETELQMLQSKYQNSPLMFTTEIRIITKEDMIKKLGRSQVENRLRRAIAIISEVS